MYCPVKDDQVMNKMNESIGLTWKCRTLVVTFDRTNMQSMNRSGEEIQHLMPVLFIFSKVPQDYNNLTVRMLNFRHGDTNCFNKNGKKRNYSKQLHNILLTRKQCISLGKRDEYKLIKLVKNLSILRYLSHTTCTRHLKKNKQSL